ncbi:MULTISPECIES: hypothetical protein [Glycomyces]|uniref:Uncharacterized protein n=1 Tax=Glycomyces lechevalierae TaxID=256034 RepID=A0ABU2AHS7_9ACTN|nr:hypothetical protein [Glycomyces lechevalierae]MDR7336774.1 hypothetical protein [Glycomyces lechevalierae]
MTNSQNPNRGHWNPAPVIDRKTPAPDNRTDQGSKSGSPKGGRS